MIAWSSNFNDGSLFQRISIFIKFQFVSQMVTGEILYIIKHIVQLLKYKII